jgi:hypothetical protein
MHGSHEGFGLCQHFLCITQFNRISIVVGNQADFLRTFQQTPEFFRDRPVFDEVFAESADERARSAFAIKAMGVN